ncbi:OpcA, an allosteric effector of glucose-6-phosphate dehydrogenase, actinobacterial [Leifsonia rubra CMS 76R]|nr:OpcA, an allosteric effector of glucose-6-phosphate dehydrogenase, actinobacterial [Leifsonia rubra CMS 76R]
MIVDLPNTTSAKISKALVRIREDGGAVALGRVLTLVIATELGNEEEAIAAANDASREHPMRVLVVSTSTSELERTRESRVDAQIRVGGDAGASEVVVVTAYGDAALDQESLITGLLLPDAPVVAWWPGEAPANAFESPLGRIAQRRITDAAASSRPLDAMHRMCETYVPGDTDFAWTRLTLWRAQLAAVLDQPPFEPISAVSVSGAADSPSTLLLAAWLQMQLQVGVSLHVAEGSPVPTGIHSVVLERNSGTITLERDLASIATLTQPNQPVHDISMPRRSLRDCLAEELRRLDPDSLFGDVVRRGVSGMADTNPGPSTKAQN